jgi:cytochrome c556
MIGGLSLAVVIGLPLAASVAQEAPKDPVLAYRSAVMKSMGDHSAAMGAILQKKVAYDQNLSIHLEGIALGARAAQKGFETKMVAGTAKEDVWTNWKDFSARLTKLDTDMTALAKKAKAGPVDAKEVMAALSCKSCHDTYRTK